MGVIICGGGQQNLEHTHFTINGRSPTLVTNQGTRCCLSPRVCMPGSILIIENEKLVCEALSDILDLGGHKSIVARDGTEGINAFKANPNEIALVILDMRLPGFLDGADVLDELQTLRPELRVIISSGDDRLKLASQFQAKENVFFLPKPYDVEAVLVTVRNALSV